MRDTEQKKTRSGTRIFITILIIVLLATLAYIVYYHFFFTGDRGREPDLPFSNGKQSLTDEEIAAMGWISTDAIKQYAAEYNINTEFLTRIFPDKIIYKIGGDIIYEDPDPNLKKHSYDWSRLQWDARRPHYRDTDESGDESDGESVEALFGIDVSRYQGDIDWQRAAADGVEFAMIRVGYRGYEAGRLSVDEYFEQNIRGAADAGVKIGVYFFSQATNRAEAIEEADVVLVNIAPYDVSFPVVFDIEDIAGQVSRTDALTSAEITDIAIAFCERVAQAGYKPMVYANPKWFVSRMELDRLEAYDKWLAQYYKTPSFPYAFSIWQFTNTGSVDGIGGDVDLNVAFVRRTH
jgi:GH25 family lysozyme M1 (1,4-beta-N-acetylmuramidase)